jgi:adenosine tuberculosinyltransferase
MAVAPCTDAIIIENSLHGEKMISLDRFLALDTPHLAELVRTSGPQVCVFPVNGTRRWFMLEHARQAGEDPYQAYLDHATQNHISLYRMFFEHGIDTLLSPIFGSDILLRGGDYMQQIGAAGLALPANGADFLKFYDEFDVRVHFYGDYRKHLSKTPYSYLCEVFDEVADKTSRHSSHRLFFGVFSSDATETVAELAIHHFTEFHSIPDRHKLVELYYGEFVEPVNLFIGFEKFTAFDMPLVALGSEDLYFTVCPSPYLSQKQLREILYDHLFTRQEPEPDYSTLSPQAWEAMRSFYRTNQDVTLGVGSTRDGIWYPQKNVEN